MTKYLDQNGLAYFWTKIKAWLSSHAPVKYFGQNWVEDTGNDYALVVGNGADENNPENGSVIWNDGRFVKLANGATASAAPASYEYANALEVRDANDDRRLVTQFVDAPNGEQGAAFKAQRLVSGTNVYHGVDFRIDSSGNKIVDFDGSDGKTAWQKALNGFDTDLVGNGFVIKDHKADLKKANNNLSANVYPNIWFGDGTGLPAARLESVIQTDGKVGFYLMAKQWDTSGNQVGTNKGIKLLVDKSDVGVWSVSEPQSFRKALALGQADGSFPITIAQGGSGMTNTLYTYNKDDLITAASGVVIDAVWAAKWGQVVWWRIDYHKTSAISVPANGNSTNFDIGTLKEGWRPVNVNFLVQGGQVNGEQGHYWLSNNKIISDGFMPSPNNSARTIGANATFMVFATYVITS